MIFAFENGKKNVPKEERVYRKYCKLMFGTAFEILQDKSLAEDAVIEAMTRIIKNIDKIGEVDSPKTRSFAVIICKNAAKDIYNKQKRSNSAEKSYIEKLCAEDKYEPSSLLLDKDTVNRMKEAIEGLDEMYRDVFLMKYAYDMRRGEIAEELGISVEAVKKRLMRAKKKIIELMGEEDKHEAQTKRG